MGGRLRGEGAVMWGEFDHLLFADPSRMPASFRVGKAATEKASQAGLLLSGHAAVEEIRRLESAVRDYSIGLNINLISKRYNCR